MSKFTSIVSYYAKHPNLVVKHALKVAGLGLSGNIRQLSRDIRLSSSAIHSAQQELEEASDFSRTLKKLLDRRKALFAENPRQILSNLAGHYDDLQILAVIGDIPLQAKVVTAHILTKYSLFDPEFYVRRYLQGVEGITPLDHYMTYGVNAGLWPNPLFDPEDYLIRYPDVAESGLDPVLHYALFGYKEERTSGDFFDPVYYLEQNPDVREAGIPPLGHYLGSGRAEGRRPNGRDGAFGEEGALFRPLPRNRGTILVVSHDAEIGGAQQIIKIFAKWLLASTQFDVKIVAMKGGPQVDRFQDIAPVFDFGGHEKALGFDEARHQLHEWAGDDVQAAFVNSVASGGFFKAWGEHIPTISYIHELPKIIDMYGDNIRYIAEHSDLVLGGSEAVRGALVKKYKVPKGKTDVVHDFIEMPPEELLVDEEQKAAARADLELEDDALLVLGCGIVHWRKSPDKFIDVAQKVLSETEKKLKFIWIGGGEDFEVCQKRVKALGLDGKVEFVGQKDDIQPYFRACDVFLLPSEEDPFPLVCLYAAMASAPVICFKDAGGMPEFVERGCGKAVPFLDVDAMAAELSSYIDDSEKRWSDGQLGRKLVLDDYTIQTAGPVILHYLREAAGLAPQLSVVVPNYNYEAYLPERLESIQKQTYQDFELILLDDVSPDNSLEVLNKYAEKRPYARVLPNKVNSGSPFKQWIKGIREARAELIWMAEADDFAENDLVETLLPSMEDRNVFLSYVKSVPVNSDGEVMGDYEPIYLDRINHGRWSRSYQCNDNVEMNEGLGIANCIPNASSVIMRKFEPDPWFEETVSKMRLCGDWFFYIRAIYGGEIAYSQRALNYHRRHASTVTSQLEGSLKYFEELQVVRNYVAERYDLSDSTLDQIEEFVTGDLNRFGLSDPVERESIIGKAVLRGHNKQVPSLAVVTPDLAPGGGQVFAISLANGWVKRGGRATLINVGQLPDHPAVVERIDPRVTLHDCRSMSGSVAELMDALDINVIHSSIWWSDRMVLANLDQMKGPPGWVVSMHGCAESIIREPEIDLTFPEKIQEMLTRVDAWAYTAEKNREVFEKYGEPERSIRIDNGIELKAGKKLDRAELGLREDALVLCLATRAIESKGWREAIEMTKRLNDQDIPTDLMLIGEGPAADALKAKAASYVHFYGQVGNLQDYIETSDIGILPSYFVGESLPLVLLEMMGMSKPVVATDVGEIARMIGTSARSSGGKVLPLKKGKPDVDGFVEALVELSDPAVRKRVGKRAKKIFDDRYTLERMLDVFAGLYDDILESKTSSPTDEMPEAEAESEIIAGE